jgi:hypothetical protein
MDLQKLVLCGFLILEDETSQKSAVLIYFAAEA